MCIIIRNKLSGARIDNIGTTDELETKVEVLEGPPGKIQQEHIATLME